MSAGSLDGEAEEDGAKRTTCALASPHSGSAQRTLGIWVDVSGGVGNAQQSRRLSHRRRSVRTQR